MSQTRAVGRGRGEDPLSAKGGQFPILSSHTPLKESHQAAEGWGLFSNSRNQCKNGGVHSFIAQKFSNGCSNAQGQYLGCPGFSGA